MGYRHETSACVGEVQGIAAHGHLGQGAAVIGVACGKAYTRDLSFRQLMLRLLWRNLSVLFCFAVTYLNNDGCCK